MNALLLFALLAPAGWGTRDCGPVGPDEQTSVHWQWIKVENSTQQALYRDGVQVGNWDEATDVYMPFDARTRQWGAPQANYTGAKQIGGPKGKSADCLCRSCTCDPCRCLAGSAESEAPEVLGMPTEDFGVEMNRISRRERYMHSGREVSAAEAHDAIGGPKADIPDDASEMRVTVIGSDTERAAVLKDLAGNPLAAKLCVQDYPADHWAIRPGFRADGHPMIYVQAPNGKVLHRQANYAGGFPLLAEAIRKADPNYDPAKDPDLNKKQPSPANPTGQSPALWVLGGLVAFVLYGVVRRRV